MASGKDTKKKNSYDARPFTEVFASLSVVQQDELRDLVMVDAGVSRVTFWAWTKGKNKPINRATMKAVEGCLKKMGIRSSYITLWP